MLLLNLPTVLGHRLRLIAQGLSALLWLAAKGGRALMGNRTKLREILTSPVGQRRLFAALRLVQPVLVLRREFIRAYPNRGTAIVSRAEDVREVLDREAEFAVVYQPRMAMITAGENFFLGMQDGERYARDTANMRLAMRRDDVGAIVQPFVTSAAAEIVEASNGRLDLPQGLTIPVAARLLDRYFGTPGPSREELADWTTTLFWYLFIDLAADPDLDIKAQAAAAALRSWLDGHIAARKSSGETRDDLLGRCLVLQQAGTPGMSDTDIRNNLIGLMIGQLPTTSATANLALDELLDRPEALRGAQAAARDDDDPLLAAHVFEALRFRPLNPVIYRRAVRETRIAEGRLRSRRIREGTMVIASNLSAMFDPLCVPDPDRFQVDRDSGTYMLWGYGLHTCFGAHMNRVTIPALLKPVLRKRRIERIRDIDQKGTPFPVHFELAFED